jgi:hypothetical protein
MRELMLSARADSSDKSAWSGRRRSAATLQAIAARHAPGQPGCRRRSQVESIDYARPSSNHPGIVSVSFATVIRTISNGMIAWFVPAMTHARHRVASAC